MGGSLRAATTAAVAVAAVLVVAGGALASLHQDDAGSGTDAPDDPVAAVWIESGERYSGTLDGPYVDEDDHYAFHAAAGQTIEGRVGESPGCFEILDRDGQVLSDNGCGLPASLEAPYEGTYFLHYHYPLPQEYHFSLGVGEDAPPPNPAPVSVFPTYNDLPEVAPASTADQPVVVALVDTGINPYHSFFRAPNLTAHPSTWIDGFPEDAEALDLTLDAASYEDALAADQALWEGVSYSGSAGPGGIQDEHVYTFPGTRVVAGVSFGEFSGLDESEADRTPVLDDDGHGTRTAGLAAGAVLDEADGNVLVVAVEVGQGDFEDGFWWAARQPWIDVVSASLGTVANIPYVFEGYEAGPAPATRHASENGIEVLVSAGNGLSNTALGPDRCTTYSSPYTGPPWVTRIGAADPDHGNPSAWHCVPVDAVAASPARAPAYRSLAGTDRLGGTSASSPNVAGHLADLMRKAHEARLDPDASVALEHLLHAAEHEEPGVALGGSPTLPAGAAVADQGYGHVDGDAVDRALDTLAAGEPAPRPVADAFFAQDERAREAAWGPGGAMEKRPGLLELFP